MIGFLGSKGSRREALGGWSKYPEISYFVVKDLPVDFRNAVEGNKSPKAPTHQQPLFSQLLKGISPEFSFRLL